MRSAKRAPMAVERNRTAQLATIVGAVLLTWATAHCGGHANTTMSTASYDRSCATDNDCAVVYAGDVCSDCNCPNAAISRTAEASYAKELASRERACEPSRVSCFCNFSAAFCNQGTCATCDRNDCTSPAPDAGSEPAFAPRDN